MSLNEAQWAFTSGDWNNWAVMAWRIRHLKALTHRGLINALYAISTGGLNPSDRSQYPTIAALKAQFEGSVADAAGPSGDALQLWTREAAKFLGASGSAFSIANRTDPETSTERLEGRPEPINGMIMGNVYLP